MQLEEESERQREYAMRLDSACTFLAVRLGEEAENIPLLQHSRREAVDAQDHLQSLVCARKNHMFIASFCLWVINSTYHTNYMDPSHNLKTDIEQLRDECKKGFSVEDGHWQSSKYTMKLGHSLVTMHISVYR